jgi:tyrosyl-tRNA synthetase
VLETLQQRCFFKDCSDESGLRQSLVDGPITLYSGFDLTAPSLHVGNLAVMMMLRLFAMNGHNVIVLFGGATTQIGDPTGKDETRRVLTREEIAANKAGILENFKQIFGDFYSKITFVDNNDWFADMNYIEFLRNIGRYFTVNQMIAMDSVRLRLEREQAMSFTEFNYMLIQAYDFLHLHSKMGCALQIGGSDQWGNITKGLDLIHKACAGKAYALSMPLITRADGQKMGKSVSGAVWLDAKMLQPFEYFHYFRNVSDADVPRFLRIFTDVSIDYISEIECITGKALNDAKDLLAFEATKICHGESVANDCLQKAKTLFGPMQTNINSIDAEFASGARLTDILVSQAICATLGGAKRLIMQSAICIDDVITTDITYVFVNVGLYSIRAGKKKFINIKIS